MNTSANIDCFLLSLIGLLSVAGALYEALTTASPLYMIGMGSMGFVVLMLAFWLPCIKADLNN